LFSNPFAPEKGFENNLISSGFVYQISAQIAFSGVGEDGDDALALILVAGGQEQGGPDCCP
jgi:hypothetical protein